jgi:hypothetical protein
MTAKRYRIYFLLVLLLAIAATIGQSRFALRRATERVAEQNLRLSTSIARFVGEFFQDQANQVKKVLVDTHSVADDKLEPALKKIGTADSITIVGADRNIIAARQDAGGLPPPAVLLALLRKTAQTKKLAITDLWYGHDNSPRVALAIGHKSKTGWRGAVAQYRLDGAAFRRLFHYFIVEKGARLQLLDSKGIAVVSSNEQEEYHSVVHGTYFTDKTRGGKPMVDKCHSCHIDHNQREVRETEVIAVAPVPGTSWSVALREKAEQMLAATQEITASTIVLVSVILGLFCGFFLLVSRRVFVPIGKIADAATHVAQNQPGEPAEFYDLVPTDDLYTLTGALKSIHTRQLNQRRSD